MVVCPSRPIPGRLFYWGIRMSNGSDIQVKFSTDLSDLKSGMSEAEDVTKAHLDQISDHFQATSDVVGGHVQSMGGHILSVMGDTAIAHVTDDLIDKLEELGKDTAEVGVAAISLRAAWAAAAPALGTAALALEALGAASLAAFAVYEVGSALYHAAEAADQWLNKISGIAALQQLQSAENLAQAESLRVLALQYGEGAQAFQHLSDVARDYKISGDDASAMMTQMATVLTAQTAEAQKARDVLKAYGIEVRGLGAGDAPAVMDAFAQRLNDVRNGTQKSADIMQVFGAVGIKAMDGIAQGAGKVSHAFNEVDRINASTMANIKASQDRIATVDPQYLWWWNQLGHWMDGVSDRFTQMVPKSEELHASQAYALSEITTAWHEVYDGVVSYSDALDRAIKGAKDWATASAGGKVAVPDAPKDTRAESPNTPPPEHAEDLSKGGSSQALAEFQSELAQKKALKQNWLADDHAIEAEFWRQKIADERAEGLEENSVMMGLMQQRLAETEKAMALASQAKAKQAQKDAATAQEQERQGQLRQLEESSNAARAGSIERVDAISAEVQYAFQTWGAMSSEYKTTLGRMLQSYKEYQAEQDGIARAQADTLQTLAHIGLQSDRDRLEAEVAEGKITEQQKIAILDSLTNAAYESDRQILADQLASLDQGTAAWQQMYGRLAALDAQHGADMDKSARDMAKAQKKAADETLQAWYQALAPVSRAFDTSIQGMVMGTQTAKQAMSRMAQSMVGEEISALAKWLQHKLLVNALGLASDQKTATGGVLATLFAEHSKTAATVSGTAARTSADTAGQAGFFGRIAAQVAGWLGLETGKTAETVAGSAERSTAEDTAAAASVTAAKLQAAAIIPAYAAEAAAAAMASVAAIPVVGWAMAPAVGAETFATAMAFLPMASAAGGWDKVPFDGAVTELHKDEMVLPAHIANPLRSILDGMPSFGLPPGFAQAANTNLSAPSNANAPLGGGSPGGGQSVTHITIQANDAASFNNMLTRAGSPLMKTIQGQLAMGARLTPFGR